MADSADQTIPIGGMIEEFRVVRILGAGNFGIVYEAANIHLDETVAIKEFLPTELARREPDGWIRPLSAATAEAFRWARARFLQEARTLWGLGHPTPHRSIVRVTGYREANGSAYMFMEFERGEALSDLLERRGTLPYEELAPIVAALLDGLARVHAANILHRDIKPANILIRADGSPVFIDFGAARNATSSGETSIFTTYTPCYAAIEQYDPSGQQGPWTDLYALGATLYRAVTGITPRSASQQLLEPRQEPAATLARGRYPDHFLQAIDRACALRPEDRPRSVSEWRQQLFDTGAGDQPTIVLPRVSATAPTRLIPTPAVAQTARSTPGVPATGGPPTPAEQAPSPSGHHRWRWLLVISTLCATVGAAAWLWWSERPLDRPAPGPTPIAPTPVPTPSPGPEPTAAPRHSPTPRPGPTATPSPTATPVPIPRPTTAPIATLAPVAPAIARITPGQRFTETLRSGGTGPTMIGIPPGDILMGSPADEPGRQPDERLHQARLAEPVAMSETEITIGQFRAFTQATGYRTEADRVGACLRLDEAGVALVADLSLSWEHPGYPVTEQHPVACVTWNDAFAYTEWLSAQTGRHYRLPTELEWEYAARAMTTSSRFWGDDPNMACDHANLADETVLHDTDARQRIAGARVTCSDGHVHAAPVGSHAANPFGLRDMIGNLAEWTCSVYDSSYGGGQARCHDPREQAGPAPMVLRGGAWLSAPDLARSAARDGMPSNLSLNTIGFRVLATEQIRGDAQPLD